MDSKPSNGLNARKILMLTSFPFKTRSFFEAVALVHVRFARVRFVLRSFLFSMKPNFFLSRTHGVEEHTFFVV